MSIYGERGMTMVSPAWSAESFWRYRVETDQWATLFLLGRWRDVVSRVLAARRLLRDPASPMESWVPRQDWLREKTRAEWLWWRLQRR